MRHIGNCIERTLGHKRGRAAARARHGLVDAAQVDGVPVGEEHLHLARVFEHGARRLRKVAERGEALERL